MAHTRGVQCSEKHEPLHEQNETEKAPLLPEGAGGESGAGVCERGQNHGSELMHIKIEGNRAAGDNSASMPTCPPASDVRASGPVAAESTGSDKHEELTLDLHQEWYHAICTSNVAAVKQLLASGAPIYYEYQDEEGTRYNNALADAVGFTDYVSPPQAKAIEVAREVIAAAARAKNRSDILDSYDYYGYRPLAWAIQGPVLEVVEALVEAGASLENVTELGESALHVAAGERYPSNLKYFLDNLTRFNIKNTPSGDRAGKRFPIHYVVKNGKVEALKLLLDAFGTEQLTWADAYGNTVLHTIADWNSFDVAQYLMSKYKYVIRMNAVNLRGETALYMSAVLRHVPLVTLFLRNGASLSALGECETAVKHVARNFADPLKLFQDLFDECISEKWNRLFMNNAIIADRGSTSQIKVIEQLESCCGSKLLKHPLIESLVHMKWKCLLPAFYIIIASYMTFLAAFNVFVVTTFYKIDSYNATLYLDASGDSEAEVSCDEGCDWLHWTLVGITYLCIGILFIQECMWVCLRKLQYFVLVESWLRLAVLALASAAPAAGCEPAPAPAAWPRHVACAGLLLAWLHALLLLARFSGWGYYAFERAAINLIKILSMAICLVISFATCFMVYYRSRPPFDGPVAAFFKTLVMMTSEFDFKDLFEDHGMELSGTRAAVRLLFMIFVVFIAIVLMNFMTGVAVSDVKLLEDMGNIRRLEKQVELLSTLDGLWDTGPGKKWKRFSQLRFHPPIYTDLMMPGRKWKPHFVFSPKTYDEVEHTFSFELHSDIYEIAKKNRNKDDLCVEQTANNMKWDTDNKENKYSNIDSKHNDSFKMILDRIKLIEDKNVEIKQCIYNFNKDLKNILLNTLTSEDSKLQRDDKCSPGKRKNMQKRKKKHLLSFKKSQ